MQKSGFTWLMRRREQSEENAPKLRGPDVSWRIKRKAAGTSGFLTVFPCETCQVAYQTCITCLTARRSLTPGFHGVWQIASHVLILSFGCTVLFRQRGIRSDFVWIKFLLNASPTLRPDDCRTGLTHSFTSFIIFILKPYETILPWNESFSITFNCTATLRRSKIRQ